MSSQSDYRALCESEARIPLFAQPWWLDAATGGDDWDVALVRDGSSVSACLPFTWRRRYGFTTISQPAMAPRLGPWFTPISGKYPTQLRRQKELMSALIEQLPRFDRFAQSWRADINNWLPFYWRGFSQTTYYSYILSDLTREEVLWGDLQENIRREIRKAKGRAELVIREDLDIDALLDLTDETYSRQGLTNPSSRDTVRRLWEAGSQRNRCRLFVAQDQAGRNHAAALIVWDADTAYYLIGGGDPELRNSGAASLCLWHAILFASTVAQVFDFEGSMSEPIERFFRGFGARQSPYFHVCKTPSQIVRAHDFLRDMRSEK